MVKYADSPSTSVEVLIAQAPAVVWPVITDINVPASFSVEFQRAEWIDNGPAVGATFRGYNRHKVVGEWNVVCTVTAMTSEQVFEWTVGDVEFKAARWRFDLEEAEGGSLLRFSAEMGPAPSGLSQAIENMPDREEEIVARRLSEWTDNMQRTIEGIRDLAESSAEQQ